MGWKRILGIIVLVLGFAVLFFALIVHGHTIAVLSPKGTIAAEQRNLIFFSVILMLFVVIPVFALLFIIAWRYRASNTKATYKPNWDHNNKLEALWWGFPCAIILILAVVTWVTSHTLDPYKPLASTTKPLTIQVIALPWRWLFLYPSENIATVNYVQFPTDRPVNFEITADAPMNSFWIPQLGGQIYAMPGMATQLHLMATEDGSYRGSSANLSGKGFADMRFMAKSTSGPAFQQWVQQVKQSTRILNQQQYIQLAKPTSNTTIVYYGAHDQTIFDGVVMKYMMPRLHTADDETALLSQGFKD